MFSRLQMCRYTNSTYLQLLRCHTVKYIIIILLKIAMRKGILVRAHQLTQPMLVCHLPCGQCIFIGSLTPLEEDCGKCNVDMVEWQYYNTCIFWILSTTLM